MDFIDFKKVAKIFNSTFNAYKICKSFYKWPKLNTSKSLKQNEENYNKTKENVA